MILCIRQIITVKLYPPTRTIMSPRLHVQTPRLHVPRLEILDHDGMPNAIYEEPTGFSGAFDAINWLYDKTREYSAQNSPNEFFVSQVIDFRYE